MKTGSEKRTFRVAIQSRIHRALLGVLASAAMITSAHALIWDGGGVDGNWKTGANWNPDVADGTATTSGTHTFQGDLQTTTVNNNAGTLIMHGYVFGNDGSASKTAAFTMGGNPTQVRQAAAIVTTANTAGSTITDIINYELALCDQSGPTYTFNFTINQQSAAVQHNLTINGTISQITATSGLNITKLGGGLLTLNGTNTYSGKTLVSAGKILMGNVLALRNSYYDTASVAGGLDLNGNTTPTLGGLTGSVNLSEALITGYGSISSLTLNPQTGIAVTYSGNLGNGNGSMALVKTGAGTQTLSSTANSYSGTTTVSAGTLTLGAAGALPSGNNVVLNGGTLNLSSGANVAGTLTLTANSTIALSTAGSLSFSSAVGDWTALDVNLALTGTLGATSLKFGNDSTGLSAAQLARTAYYLASGVAKPVTLDASGYVTAGSTDGTWDQNSNGDWTAITNWTGDAAYASGADATATFANNITLDRTINLNTPITIGHISALDADKNYTISGANILTLDTTTGIPSISVGTAGRTLTISSEIQGSDGLNKIGAGILRLSGANSYSGGTTVTEGTLTFASGSLGTTGNITLAGGTLQWAAANTQDIGTRLRTSGANALKLDVNGNAVVFGTALTDASLTQGLTLTSTAANGSLKLTGANTYSGTTTLGTVTLILTDSGDTLTAGALVINTSSTTARVTSINGVGLGGTWNLQNGGLTVGVSGISSAVLNIDGGVTVNNAGEIKIGYLTGGNSANNILSLSNGVSLNGGNTTVGYGSNTNTSNSDGNQFNVGAAVGAASSASIGSLTVGQGNSNRGQGNNNQVTVRNATLNMSGGLTIGSRGANVWTSQANNNNVTVLDGGTINMGANSIIVGHNAVFGNSLVINGGRVLAGGLTLGSGTGGSTSSVSVTNNGVLNIAGNITVGGTGSALTVGTGSVVTNAGTLSVASGNSVVLEAGGQIYATNAVVWAGGVLRVGCDNAQTPSSGRLTVSGNLNITGSTLNLTNNVSGIFVIATYGSRTAGAFAATNGLPAGGRIDYSYGGNQIAVVAPPAGTVLIVR